MLSFAVIFTVIFLGIAGLLAGAIYGIGIAIKWQANKPVKRFFAPVPRPGSFSFVMLEGRVVDIIENVVVWMLEDTKPEGTKSEKHFVPDHRDPGFWEKTLGVRWIGLFETIKIFKEWRWTEFQQVEREERGQRVLKYEIVPRGPADVPEFFFQFSHPVVIDDVEIDGNIRVNVVTLITVLNLHPTRAFFLNKDPTGLFAAIVKSAIRSYISKKTFDQVKEMVANASKGNQDTELWNILKNLNGLTTDEKSKPDYDSEDTFGIFSKLGQIIIRAEIVQVEAVGDTADALEAKRLAELRGDANIAAAEKAARTLIVAAQGRMDAAQRDASAQRTLNEQNAGYFASLPDGGRMFAASQVASKDSSVSTWVEGNSDVKVTLPLPPAPPRPPEPEKVETTGSKSPK